MKNELIQILLKVQSELPVIGRTTKAYNYKYAPLDEVWEKVRKTLQSNGFVIVNEVTDTGIKTRALHEHGELESFIPFSHLDLKPQERGSEITYARRYNLTSIFNIIIADEDDDAQTTVNAPVKGNYGASNKATPKQLKFIRDLLAQKGHTEKELEVKYEVGSVDDLTFDQASTVIGNLSKLPDAVAVQGQIELDNDEIDKGIEQMQKGKK